MMENPVISLAAFASYPPHLQNVHSPPEHTMILDLSSRKQTVPATCSSDYNHNQTHFDPYQTPRSIFRQSESPTDLKDVNSNNISPRSVQTRPFKSYFESPSSISFGILTEDILDKDSAEAYAEFRQKMLSQVQSSQSGTNKNMRRLQSQNANIDDPFYWEKRKKNNEAAKKSRDARKAKEDEIAIRCAFLEQENIRLKFKLASLESERLRLQKVIYS